MYFGWQNKMNDCKRWNICVDRDYIFFNIFILMVMFLILELWKIFVKIKINIKL
jgi:hypothetical protein